MDKPTARQRSAFGAFQMGKSHIKSGIAQVVPRPRATDMAEMRAAGKSFEEIAEAVGLRPGTVRTRLSQAGFGADGLPKAKP